MTYFFDRSLGRMIPRTLRTRGIDAVAHDSLFAQDTPDDEWLADIGRRGWTVLTKDDRIRYNEAERQALITYNVGCFAVMRRNDTREQILATLEAAWERIEEIATSETHPFFYAIHKDGTVHKKDLATK